MEIFSIQSTREKDPKADFHDWQTLGSTVVADAEVRESVVEQILVGIAEGGRPAGCFIPRHAIRVTTAGKMVDFLICFRCSHVNVYGIDDAIEYANTSKLPQTVLDMILTDAKIKRVKKAKD